MDNAGNDEPDIHHFMLLNSFHLPLEDRDLLDELSNETSWVMGSFSQGRRLFVDVVNEAESYAKIENCGFSKIFIDFYKLAAKRRCWWIHIDDNVRTLDLPVFF